MHGFTILMISIEQIWCGTCLGFKSQALYTRRENPWFCVVNRTRTTSKNAHGILIIQSSLFCNIMNFIVLIAVVVALPFCLLKVPNMLTEGELVSNPCKAVDGKRFSN